MRAQRAALAELPPFDGLLTRETAPQILAILNGVLKYPCAVIRIIRDTEWTETTPSVVHEIHPDGIARLSHYEDGRPYIDWHGGGWYSMIDESAHFPVRVQWRADGSYWAIQIRQNAPAGHPLVWIYTPEIEPEVSEALCG